jgi:hypothetical protein
MRFIFRAGGATLLTGAVCAGLALAPTAALARPSVAAVASHVHAADAALTQMRHLVRKHPAAARHALVRNRAEVTAAAHAAKAVSVSGNVSATASALSLVASQFDRDVRAYTSLIPTSSGSLQAALAQALAPALAGRTVALGFLAQLTGKLPAAGAGDVTSVLVGILQNLPGEISSLTGIVQGGQLPGQLQTLIAKALTTASGLLDAGLAQVQSLIPTLPAPLQTVVSDVLTQLKALFGQLETTLNQAVQSISTVIGGPIGQMLSGQLSQVLGLLQGFFNGNGLTGLTGLTGGTGGTGGTGATGSGGGAGFLAGLPIPSFIQDLLKNLGVGGLFFAPHASAH